MKLSQPVAFALATLVQIGIFYGLYLGLSQVITIPPSLSVVSARIISESPSEEPKPEIEPPKPKPVTEKAVKSVSRPQPLVVPAAPQTPSETAPTAVVNQQTEKPVDMPVTGDATVVAAAPAPPPTPPRFDADYLNNPKPDYPPLSRRQNEQGRVQVRVLVNAKGIPEDVRLQKTSGFPRLDETAIKTVAQWRFVPARRGNEPVSDWVIVPVDFQLN